MCWIVAMLRYFKKGLFLFSPVNKITRVRVRKKAKMIGLSRNFLQRCSTANIQLTPPLEKLIILEGNIGAGKTTLACQLARKLNYKLFLEPTTKNPYLAKFYEDPKKYALKLQLWIFRQRFRMFIKASRHLLETGQGVLLDRSVFSDCVFADVNYQEGTISEDGYKYYNELKNKALKSLPLPHVLIYINASPEICFERIHGRGRNYESGIPMGYLQGLDKAYKNMLNDMRNRGSQVLVYDWANFGYQHEVSIDVKSATTISWSQDVLVNFWEIVTDKSKMNQALNLDYSIPEAEFTEETDEECDMLQEEEQKGHKLESTKRNAQIIKLEKETIIKDEKCK